MEWKKAPEEVVQFLAEKMENIDCEYRKMFGYPAYFIRGNMFAGIHGKKLFLRLSKSDAERIVKNYPEALPFEPMPARKMKGYVVLPKSFYLNAKLFAEWFAT